MGMSLNLTPAMLRRAKNPFTHRIFTPKGIMQALRLTFISGPRLLFTSRLSAKSASLMILLSIPALLLTLLLTIPPLLFNSPEQHAYYEFANAINHDPTYLIILAFAALCTIISLAIPATEPTPFIAVKS